MLDATQLINYTFTILLILLVLIVAFALTTVLLAEAPGKMNPSDWGYADLPVSMWTVWRMLLGGESERFFCGDY